MIQEQFPKYLEALDANMRRLVDGASTERDFTLMMRYPMGWANADDTPYDKVTGKRLRPLFLLLCNEAVGGEWREAIPAASAVEILHNFSLIHDDIQDQSDIRHGRDTVWRVWGVADAINAGDGMFTLAYRALEELNGTLPPENLLYLWKRFNDTNLSLTTGQYMDMSFEHEDKVSVQRYIQMLGGKTASLLAFCALAGAYIGTKNEELAELFWQFGNDIGISFQIRDDILGIWGDAELMGKSSESDIVSRKKSLPVLYGLEKDTDLQNLYASPDKFEHEQVEEVVALLDRANAREYAQEQEHHYFNRAMQALEQTDMDNPKMDGLKGFVSALLNRQY